MLFEIPNPCLACMVTSTYYFEQLEIFSTTRLVTSVEVNETFSRTKRKYAIVFIECHAENISCIMWNRKIHRVDNLRDGIVLGNARDCLVRHSGIELDVPLVSFQSNESVSFPVKYGLNNWIVTLNLVFEDVALMEFVNALCLGQLQHISLVQILWSFLFKSHEMLSNSHGSC